MLTNGLTGTARRRRPPRRTARFSATWGRPSPQVNLSAIPVRWRTTAAGCPLDQMSARPAGVCICALGASTRLAERRGWQFVLVGLHLKGCVQQPSQVYLRRLGRDPRASAVAGNHPQTDLSAASRWATCWLSIMGGRSRPDRYGLHRPPYAMSPS